MRCANLAFAVLLVSAAAHADYGDLPPQPGDVGYVKPDLVAPDESRITPSKPSPIDWEIATTLGYVSPPIRGGTNPFGVGIGGRAGLSAFGLYAGITIVDFLGGRDVSLSDRSLLIGGEFGYGGTVYTYERQHFKIVLRGLVGVGNAAVSHDDPALAQNTKPDIVTTASGRTINGSSPSTTVTANNIYVRPTLSLMFIHQWQYVAIEGDVLVVPGISYGGADPSTWIAYGTQLHLGARF